jgi:hypothetical protein
LAHNNLARGKSMMKQSEELKAAEQKNIRIGQSQTRTMVIANCLWVLCVGTDLLMHNETERLVSKDE